jgi:hypothetical protein
MKKVRYLKGVAGVAPAALGLLAVQPAAAAVTPGHAAEALTHPAKSVSLHPIRREWGHSLARADSSSLSSIQGGSGVNSRRNCPEGQGPGDPCSVTDCSKAVCVSVFSRPYSDIVFLVNEKVDYGGKETKTWHLRDTVCEPRVGCHTQTRSWRATFGAGWQKHLWIDSAISIYSRTKWCAGAGSTPGYPCVTAPV